MNYETSLIGAQSDESTLSGEMIQRRSAQSKLLIAIIVVLTLAAAGAAAYYFMGGNKTQTAEQIAKEKEGQQQNVTVIAPGAQTIIRTINATGTLAAKREVPVGVVGEGGQVSQVFVNAGDWVQAGQVLITIDRSVQVQQAIAQEAQIGVARADMQLAQNELERALKLVDRGFISKADVDRKTAARDSARARINVANAQLNETRARNARLDIRAPVTGFVLERKVEPGQTVSAGSGILFRLAQGGEMELQALLGEADLGGLSNGIAAVVTPVGDSRQFNGRIWQIAPMIDAQSRQGMARIALPFDRALRPGGFASVEIKAGAITAPVLPESAVQNDKNGSFVYIIGAANKVERRAVKTGDVTPQGLTIVEGLSGSERVVLYAGGFLNAGEEVTPKLQTTTTQAPVKSPTLP
jgi:HlyD family secretion protein